MKFGTIKTDERLVRVLREDRAVARIEMVDREGRNSLSPELVGALLAALDETDEDEDCAAVVLTGTDTYFSAGATRGLLEDLRARRIAPIELALSETLLRHSAVIIAAAEGHAIGGGFALMMAADMAVLAEESRYGFNFMAHGITPGMGVTRLAEDYLGKPLAHRLLYTGDLQKGAAFKGSFLDVHPKQSVLSNAIDLAYAVAEKPAKNVAMLKRTLAMPRLKAFEKAQIFESLMHETSLKTLDFQDWSSND